MASLPGLATSEGGVMVRKLMSHPVRFRAMLKLVTSLPEVGVPTGTTSQPSCCTRLMLTMAHCASRCGT